MDLSRARRSNEESSARLASGSKLSRTSSDPGGYAVALKLRHTSSVIGALETNLINARSFLEIQGSELSSLGSILQRMDEIATLMKDSTKSTQDQDNYLTEFNQLREAVRTLQDFRFNDRRLFLPFDAGQRSISPEALSIQIDSAGNAMSLTQSDFTNSEWLSLLDISAPYISPDTASSPDIVSYSNAGGFQALIQIVSTMIATNGAEQSRLNFAIDNLRTKATAFEEAHSRIADVDVAKEVTRLNRSSVLLQSGAAMMTQANVSNELALRVLGA